jgi:hypothetical protein
MKASGLSGSLFHANSVLGGLALSAVEESKDIRIPLYALKYLFLFILYRQNPWYYEKPVWTAGYSRPHDVLWSIISIFLFRKLFRPTYITVF